MKSIKCPNCGCKIAGVRDTHFNSPAVKAIIRHAKKPQPIGTLAFTYGVITGADYRSCRRAIERLVKDGYLKRVKQGVYQSV